MILRDVGAMAEAVPGTGALLGLDLGTRTIGVAASDPARRIASPVTTIRRTKFTPDAARLFALMDDRNVVGLVLGWPVEMSGEEGKRCQSTRNFAENVLHIRDIPVLLWDERLSTSAVERMMVQEFDLSRRKRAEKVDAAAAAYILQGALDALARQPQTRENMA
ncbi:Holliday junction resolvase RuvX [Rhodospira trueperi]|uniref:Putative pre-16S rRNA nuclease n=1 Tax=Rhodospira trueperi TaxID=69960 RepID=A0A1G7EIH4_9PROT|nr:Holliday junction resolvase RuvX [Rhodospira trueperi]SDE63387.1 putative holliday junction resolvase [Rhodospira trueperi]